MYATSRGRQQAFSLEISIKELLVEFGACVEMSDEYQSSHEEERMHGAMLSTHASDH
jgi:hypothetical protein